MQKKTTASNTRDTQTKSTYVSRYSQMCERDGVAAAKRFPQIVVLSLPSFRFVLCAMNMEQNGARKVPSVGTGRIDFCLSLEKKEREIFIEGGDGSNRGEIK